MELVKTQKQIEFDAFVERLKTGIVSFAYTKKDDSIRAAKGTLCPEFIPDAPAQEVKKEYDHTQNYFDIDAENGLGGWRTFIKDNFIGMVPQS